MKSMRLHTQGPAEDRRLELKQVPQPEPAADELLVKIHLCGVCHTDLHIVEGDIQPPSLPLTPGHQVVGQVAGVGGEVRGWEVGDRVGIPWLYNVDGTCEFCAEGRQNLCPQAEFTGFDVDGGFAEYMLAKAAYTLPLPENLGGEQAAPLLCAGIIGFRSLRQAGLQPGERLGLIGFGASAHLAIQVARHWDCPTYVFTRAEEHREHARQLGAEFAGGLEDENHPPLHRAVLFAPVGDLVPPILKKLRRGGTLAINAIHLSPIPELPYHLIYMERTLRSVANATYQDGLEFLKLAAEIPVEATTNLYPLEAANQALLDLKHSRINGEAVLDMRGQD